MEFGHDVPTNQREISRYLAILKQQNGKYDSNQSVKNMSLNLRIYMNHPISAHQNKTVNLPDIFRELKRTVYLIDHTLPCPFTNDTFQLLGLPHQGLISEKLPIFKLYQCYFSIFSYPLLYQVLVRF